MVRVGWLVLTVLLMVGAAGEAAAVIVGPCVGRCLQDRGQDAGTLCVELCQGGGAGVGCASDADGCCNEYFTESDPDCGPKCGEEIIGLGGACDPACNQCEAGASCQETAPGSGAFICK